MAKVQVRLNGHSPVLNRVFVDGKPFPAKTVEVYADVDHASCTITVDDFDLVFEGDATIFVGDDLKDYDELP